VKIINNKTEYESILVEWNVVHNLEGYNRDDCTLPTFFFPIFLWQGVAKTVPLSSDIFDKTSLKINIE
jgi:hypothetical protein